VKILITGASGLLGSNLSFLYAARHQIIAQYFQHPISIPNCKMLSFDLCDFEQTESVLKREKPEILIHCAANANVDLCEANPDEAFLLNTESVKRITGFCRQLNIKLVFISTDSVFTEDRPKPFKEEEDTHPKNIYAQTKQEAEIAIQRELSSALIVRTCIYGWNALPKQGLAEWMIEELSSTRMIQGFTDTFFTPILVNDLAEAIELALRKNLSGVYHMASRDSVSKYEFACLLAKRFGLNSSLVCRSSILTSPLKACRPKRPCLDVQKFEKAAEKKLPTAEEGIDHFFQLLKNGYQKNIKHCALVSHEMKGK